MSGKLSYAEGIAAEEAVGRLYAMLGYEILEARWRGQGGEIDLIIGDDDGFIFVEVKKAKSHDRALERVRPAQVARIQQTACEYLANAPKGLLSDMRFDVATVDQTGDIRLLENAFM